MSLGRVPPVPRQPGVASTTRSLVAGLKHCDGEAWNRLVRVYTPLVYYWGQRYNLEHDDILDVVQEVFRSVAENVQRFRKERPGDTFRGWLRVIARNKAMDVHRRNGREARGAGGSEALRRLESIPAPCDAELGAHSNDDRVGETAVLVHGALDEVRRAFRRRTWTAFWRVVVDGRTPADVAEELGSTPGAVRVAKSRVLQRLRLELDDSFRGAMSSRSSDAEIGQKHRP